MAVRSKKHENLTDSNLQHVIDLLRADKPITKKEACSILNISYNTTRLNKLIEEYEETVRYRELRKAQNKGKGVTEAEKKSIVTYYLDGQNISDIAKALYRSPAFIKAVIERLGIPQKLATTDYEGIRLAMLPEQCVAETFDEEERVWSIKGNCIAIVKRELGNHQTNYEQKYGSKMYYVHEIEMAECESPYFGTITNAGRGASRLAHDLGSLKHLNEYL